MSENVDLFTVTLLRTCSLIILGSLTRRKEGFITLFQYVAFFPDMGQTQKRKLQNLGRNKFALPQFSRATEHSAPGWNVAVTESSATDYRDMAHTERAYE
jgi:hypothetical protein